MPQKKAKKSTTTKKPATAKKPASRAGAKRPKKSTVRSLRPAPESEAFFVFRLSRQTIYWIVLGVIVVAFASWIYKLQSDIQAIYDQIDQTVLIEQATRPAKQR